MSSTRSAWRIYVKDGVRLDGRIIARKVTSYADSGAYSRQTPYALTKHAANAAGPYAIPNVSIDAYCVYTNRQPTSAMRGFGVTMASFAIEVQMDKIAERLGLDPWTIRFINAYHDGDMKPHRKLVEDATLDRDDAGCRGARRSRAAGRPAGDDVGAARRRPCRGARLMAKLRGTGIAAVNYPTGMNLGGDPSQALIHATTSGSFVVTLSATDLGQGLKTVIGQIAAETLGVDLDRRVHRHRRHRHGSARHGHVREPGDAPRRQRGDGRCQRGPPRRCSRSPPRSSRRRARPRDRRPRQRHVKGAPSRSVKVDGDRGARPVHVRPDDRGTRQLHEAEEPRWTPRPGRWTPIPPRRTPAPWPRSRWTRRRARSPSCSIRSAYEVGRQVNPALVRGQIEGGAWMGMSHALYETTAPYYPAVTTARADFSEYLMPGPLEMPEIECVVLEMPVLERPIRREGARRDDGQLADPGHRQRDLPRHGRADRRAARSRPSRSCVASRRAGYRRPEFTRESGHGRSRCRRPGRA